LILGAGLLRPYGLLALLNLLYFDQLFILLNAGSVGSWWQHIKYILLMISLLYLHTIAPIIIAGHICLLVFGIIKRWWNKKQLVRICLSLCVGAIIYLPIFVIDLQSTMKFVNLWTGDAPWVAVFIVTICLIGNDFSPLLCFLSEFQYRLYVALQTPIWTILVYMAVVFFPRGKQLENENNARWLNDCFIVTLSSLVILFLLFLKWQHMNNHYVLPFTAFFFVILVVSIARAPIGRDANKRAYLLITACLLIWLPQLISMYLLPPSAEYESSKIIKANFSPSHDLVVCVCEVFATELVRDLPQQFNLVAFPDIEKRKFIN
jgi:hypothetical protein